MSTLPIWMPGAFFLAALVYAMVGFGGGSSYLALLALTGLPYKEIPSLALVCNVIVSIGGCYHFYRAGHFKWNLILPFVVFSIPMAYWGGRITIGNEAFALLLGCCLLMVAVRLLLPDSEFDTSKCVSRKKAWIIGIPAGGLLGFLSGLVGIGGGIFLSPILLVMRWVNAKEAAAAASFFIVVNSVSGLLGQMHKGGINLNFLFPLGVAVFLGGQIGSHLGAYRLPKVILNRVLGSLLLYAATRLIGAAL